MKPSSQRRTPAVLLAAIALASCSAATSESGPRTVQPGAPGDSSRLVSAEAMAGDRQPRHSEADVRFMQHMIAHHAQALVMTDLVAERTDSEAIRLLAERIEVSQEDEIALMQNWLEERGEEVPSPGEHGPHHAAGGSPALMPGMLTREELDRLAAATGAEFDRLFLELMIRHHEGALAMVAELFASEGAAQEPETFRIASEVDADQRIEIARMRSLLDAGP